MAVKDAKLQRNILSISTSTYVLGGFHIFMLVFVLLVVLFGGIYQQEWSLPLWILLSSLISVFWLVTGYKIRKYAMQPDKALQVIALVMYVSIAYLAYHLYEVVVSGVSMGIIIIAIFTSYIIWSYMDIRDRINGKK